MAEIDFYFQNNTWIMEYNELKEQMHKRWRYKKWNAEKKWRDKANDILIFSSENTFKTRFEHRNMECDEHKEQKHKRWR